MAQPKPKPERKPKGKPRKIAILDPDIWFSLCVRERADWTCQACGKQYPPWFTAKGIPANPGLHCSHYVGRGNYAVRFDPDNAVAHCYGCHTKFEGNPHNFMAWTLERLGQTLYDILIEKSNNLMLGKEARRSKAEIAAHYKSQFEKMRELRMNGRPYGRIDFQGYF